MKKRLSIIISFLLIWGLSFSTACIIDVSMINQDPYPGIPGEVVKVVFQIDGVSNTRCGTIEFEVKENFPFKVDPESTNPIIINPVTYAQGFSSYYLATYKIRIDKDALDGNNPIEVAYGSSQIKQLKEFNIYTKDTRTNFEIHVKDYNSKTQTFTLEILNIGKVDVESLTIEIPKQDNIEVKGTNRIIVGSLDSNEYTTATFEAIMKNEGEVDLKIIYTDLVNVRREQDKKVYFDPSYFDGLKRDSKTQPYWIYILLGVVVIGFLIWRKHKKNKLKKKLYNKQ